MVIMNKRAEGKFNNLFVFFQRVCYFWTREFEMTPAHLVTAAEKAFSKSGKIKEASVRISELDRAVGFYLLASFKIAFEEKLDIKKLKEILLATFTIVNNESIPTIEVVINQVAGIDIRRYTPKTDEELLLEELRKEDDKKRNAKELREELIQLDNLKIALKFFLRNLSQFVALAKQRRIKILQSGY